VRWEPSTRYILALEAQPHESSTISPPAPHASTPQSRQTSGFTRAHGDGVIISQAGCGRGAGESWTRASDFRLVVTLHSPCRRPATSGRRPSDKAAWSRGQCGVGLIWPGATAVLNLLVTLVLLPSSEASVDAPQTRDSASCARHDRPCGSRRCFS
jgi:hypothetical protein